MLFRSADIASSLQSLCLSDFSIILQRSEGCWFVEGIDIGVIIVTHDDIVAAGTAAQCEIASDEQAASLGGEGINAVISGTEIDRQVLVEFQVGVDDLQNQSVLAVAKADCDIAIDGDVGLDFQVELIIAVAEADIDAADGGRKRNFEGRLWELTGQLKTGCFGTIDQQGGALNFKIYEIGFAVPDDGDVAGF